jgi:hypothetical protein
VGCPTVPLEIRMLIRTMSTANPLWGAPRIHGELLKLGIEVGQATVAKYMVGQRQPPSQTWRTFVRNHGGQNAYVECVIGAIRRECLDHLIILNAADCVASSAGTSDTTRRHARIWCSRRTLPCPPCVSTHLRGNRRDSSGRRSSPPIRTSRCLASSAEGSQRRGRDRQPPTYGAVANLPDSCSSPPTEHHTKCLLDQKVTAYESARTIRRGFQ